ncbi:small ribosomal subunit protein eS6-like, partial [Bombus flavifrons]|uniref:small ribosomal subunit protein eS6-like n=1 Tax=Bombus flavifrons TaxID=103934 RepID=UPI003703D9FC
NLRDILVIVKKGEKDIPDLTDKEVPRRLGPKRASKIRKLLNLSKEDDVRRFVVKRPIQKEGKPQRSKAPKIHLIIPLTLQRKRHRLALKRRRCLARKQQAAEYAKLLAQRQKEAKNRHQEELKQRRSASMRDSKSSNQSAPTIQK